MIEGVNQIKVLLVDDDENYLKITTMYLQENGLNMFSSSNPVEALKMCKEGNIDIVLLDYFMPELTGEEFVKKLREFNNSALVILQTGFSEKKPPLETLTSLDIQGYHDKTKGVDELLLLTLSAIKTMKLIKLNKVQELKLNSLNYKKQLIGEITVGLLNEAKNQLMSISASNQAIKMDTDAYSEENQLIEKANEKINNLFTAIGFESTEVMSVDEMIDTVEILLESKKKENLANITMSVEGGGMIVKKNIDTIIFLIVETILQLLDNGEKEIHFSVSAVGELVVKFNNEIKTNNEFTKKVVMLLVDRSGLKYKIVNSKPEITCSQLM
jgi:CheY-like chemotaxis protein